MNDQTNQPNLIIVTGYSGAGLSSTLKTLEDLGFEVFDNFPLSLAPQLMDSPKLQDKPLAIGIDTRNHDFAPENIKNFIIDRSATLVFITCEDQELQRRFSETRRRHPLAGNLSVSSGIAQEKNLLQSLKEAADIIIDTTSLSVHDLRHRLEGDVLGGRKKDMNITLMSFGFKNGAPRDADIIMDVRFLKNPHWNAALKPHTGKDKDVADYILTDPDALAFIENFKTLIKPLIPRYKQEGKTYLTIAFGCTGGKHRSVFLAETIGTWLKENGHKNHIDHRDLPNTPTPSP